MKFHSFDAQRKTFSVTIERSEVEGLQRLMRGVARNISDLDCAAIGVYSENEVAPYIEYLDALFGLYGEGGEKIKVVVPKIYLLRMLDVALGVSETEGAHGMQKIGVTPQEVERYIIEISRMDELEDDKLF